MKIDRTQLKEMIRKTVAKKLNEAFDNKLNDTVPEGVAEYAAKINKFLHSTIDEARKLHDEGEEMMRANVLSSYEVQERNRFILYRVGFLNTLIASLVHRIEDEHRQG
jgi:hypothetical protein